MRLRPTRSPNKTSPRKSVFITGAAAGIGEATARLFARRGWYVGVAGRNPDKLEALCAELGEENCSRYTLDVTDIESVNNALAEFSARTGGKLHLLINNAGFLQAGNFEGISLEAHNRIIDTNVKGVLNCTHAAFELLKKTPGARVINMSSASANIGAPDFASYSASKFAVRALTEALHVEWARHDIIVSDIMPPFVDTGMLDDDLRNRIKAISRLGIGLTADDVARSIWNTAHARRVHERVNLPSRLMSLGQKYTPESLQLRVVRFLSGY